MDSGCQMAWIQILTLLATSCMTSGNLLPSCASVPSLQDEMVGVRLLWAPFHVHTEPHPAST